MGVSEGYGPRVPCNPPGLDGKGAVPKVRRKRWDLLVRSGRDPRTGESRPQSGGATPERPVLTRREPRVPGPCPQNTFDILARPTSLVSPPGKSPSYLRLGLRPSPSRGRPLQTRVDLVFPPGTTGSDPLTLDRLRTQPDPSSTRRSRTDLPARHPEPHYLTQH